MIYRVVDRRHNGISLAYSKRYALKALNCKWSPMDKEWRITCEEDSPLLGSIKKLGLSCQLIADNPKNAKKECGCCGEKNVLYRLACGDFFLFRCEPCYMKEAKSRP